jgi:exopolysaccharide production protein ExoQ
MHSRILEANRTRIYDARQNRSARRIALSGHPAPKAIIDKCAIVPLLACVFALIVSPLFGYFTPLDRHVIYNGAARLEPRIFWPVMAAISVMLALQNRSRLAKLTWPPHIICLAAYLAFAGASVLWAFNPGVSTTRFAQQAMVVTSIVLPTMLAARAADMMRGLFLCFALALILNVFFVLEGSVDIVNCTAINRCYQGYFEGKNYLGECAAVAFLLSFHEMLCSGWRRALGIIVIAIATVLIFLSDSKTALGLIIISPFLAKLTLTCRKITRSSPAIILLTIPVFCTILSTVFHVDLMDRMAYMLYHDSTLTGRTIIWEFAQYEIGRRPLLGWGYQSFWLVPNSPSAEAPGWVKLMPNAHNGYYDTTLEMGYVGLAFLYVFIIATLHGIGRVADRDPARARLLLSLVLFFIMWNYFESLWMRGFEFLWVVFLIAAAEIGRYWQPFPLTKAANRSGRRRLVSPGASSGARMPRPRIGLS